MCKSAYVLFLKSSRLTMFPSHHQPATAWALKQVWPELTLHIVPDAGHSSREPGITKLLVEVTLSHPSFPRKLIVFLRLRTNSQTSERLGTRNEREAHDGGWGYYISASYPFVASVSPPTSGPNLYMNALEKRGYGALRCRYIIDLSEVCYNGPM